MCEGCFYITDCQKLLMRPLIKRLEGAFVSKNAAERLKRSAKLLKHSAQLLRIQDKTESLNESFKSSAEGFKDRPYVCVITQSILSKSATVL